MLTLCLLILLLLLSTWWSCDLMKFIVLFQLIHLFCCCNCSCVSTLLLRSRIICHTLVSGYKFWVGFRHSPSTCLHTNSQAPLHTAHRHIQYTWQKTGEQSGNKATPSLYLLWDSWNTGLAVHLITIQKLFSHMTSTFNLVKDDLLTMKWYLLKDWKSEFGFNNSSCSCTVHRKCSMG